MPILEFDTRRARRSAASRPVRQGAEEPRRHRRRIPVAVVAVAFVLALAALILGGDGRGGQREVVVATAAIPAGVVVDEQVATVVHGDVAGRPASRADIERGAVAARDIPAGAVIMADDVTATSGRRASTDSTSPVGMLAGGGSVAAAGVFAGLWYRRRQRTGRASRTSCTPPPADAGPMPLAIEIAANGATEILWNARRPHAGRGWRAADGGWAWRSIPPHSTAPIDDLLPTLIEIGIRNERRFLLNAEAVGHVTVTGPPDRVDAAIDRWMAAVGSRSCTVQRVDDAARLGSALRDLRRAADRTRPFGRRRRATSGAVAVVSAAAAARLGPVPMVPVGRGVAVIQATMATDGGAGRAPGAVIAVDGDVACLQPLGIRVDIGALPVEAANIGSGRQSDVARPVELLAAPPSAAPPPIMPPTAAPSGVVAVADRAADPVAVFARADVGLVVRVLGVPCVPQRPRLGRRETIVTVFLACHARAVNVSAVQDALWAGRPIEPKTVWNLLARTRSALGEFPDGSQVLPATDRSRGVVRVDERVVTDLAVARAACVAADIASSSEAIAMLERAVVLIEGPPFDASGYDWAHATQHVAEANAAIEDAVMRLVRLAGDAGHWDLARSALTSGIRGLPGNEQLYRARMQLEHDLGNTAGVIAAYEELTAYLAEFDSEPLPVTVAHYNGARRTPAGSRR